MPVDGCNWGGIGHLGPERRMQMFNFHFVFSFLLRGLHLA
uniref:Uncharacterized protein n=1 Tax=Setaria italica TaxID=4555 RepID=K3Z1S1_SETIT